MTVAIVTVAYGKKYRAFLPQWYDAINNLERTPDHVIVVTDDASAAITHPLKGSVYVKQVTGGFINHPQILANQGIALTNAQWICKMDVDDLIYPHALNELDDVRADIYCFGISVNGEIPMPAREVTAQQILEANDNLLFAGSPFRRWVWEQSSGFQDMLYDDWAFWREAAANGARFQASPNLDYQYTLAEHNATNHANHQIEAQKVMANVH